LGADKVYLLPTAGPCELAEPPRGALAMLVHATGLLVRQGLAHDLAALPGRDRIVVLPPPCPITVQPSDFSRAEWLIEEGYREAMSFLASHLAEGVADWRKRRLETAGFDPSLAAELATTATDLHELLNLLDQGCPPELAARILGD
jgi:hypothetical protein